MKYVKPLISGTLITEFQKEHNCRFPAEYIECVKKYNGGRPNSREFISEKNMRRITWKEVKPMLNAKPMIINKFKWANQILAIDVNTNNYLLDIDDDTPVIRVCGDKDNNVIIFVDYKPK